MKPPSEVDADSHRFAEQVIPREPDEDQATASRREVIALAFRAGYKRALGEARTEVVDMLSGCL